MKLDINSSSSSSSGSGNHNKQIKKMMMLFVKMVGCLVFLGCAYRIYFSTYNYYYYVQFPPLILLADGTSISLPVDNFTVSGPIPANYTPVNNTTTTSSATTCDVFSGEWVRDSSGPQYTYKSCDTIEHHQNCIKNGRPDTGYIYWRWRPRDCDLPRFNPNTFLNFMTNKSMAFIGDSISRNHVQSLLCMLSQVEQMVEVYHDEEYRSRRWFFDSHNFTLSVIWSPFLTEAKTFEDNDGHASDTVRLHLDEPDSQWVNEFGTFDYVEIAAGKWFLKTAVYYENNTIIGCHNCKKENVSELSFYYAYQRALQTSLNFITRSDHKVYTLLQTTTPDHFENGEWNTGGYCNRTTPFKESEIKLRDIDTTMRETELEEFKKAVRDSNLLKKGSTLKLFDTTRLALLRPDGHPGPYREFHPFDGKDMNAKVQNDCLHWCLPGPIDSWNDLLMNILLKS